MVILMIPEVISASTARQSLAFRLEVEEADLANVPAIVDGALVTRVNEALTPETTRMIWHFGNALDRRTALPARLEPLDALVTKVTGGAVGVDDQRVCFSLRLALEVKRHRERPTDESRT
jgi:hypothetical protein